MGLCMKERLIRVADDRMTEIALLFLYEEPEEEEDNDELILSHD